MTSLNSVISDPEPYVAPKPPKQEETPESDWRRLGKSKKYKAIDTYLENRKEYYRRFTPGGEPVERLSEAERMAAWGQAMCVIKEIEAIQANIAIHTT